MAVDADDSSSSGDDEDDEDDGEADDDDDDDALEPARPIPMQITAQSDDDEVLDAHLFFSNLLYSSASEDEGHQSDHDSIMGDVVVARGDSTDEDTDANRGNESIPLMVKESWDGQLVFSTETHPVPGVLDLAFENNTTRPDSPSQTDSLSASLSSLPVLQPAIISDDELEYFQSDEGQTTDDEILPPGLTSVPPSTTISPHVTISPIKPSSRLHRLTTALPSPSPADVLAGRRSFSWDELASPGSVSTFTTDEPPPRSSSPSLSRQGSRGPRMGFFRGKSLVSGRTIIGDTTGKLPSPFSEFVPTGSPIFRRKRRANVSCGR